jgi:hypothetical protein
MKRAMSVIRAAAGLAAAAIMLPAGAQLLADPVVVPAQPLPFETVNARLTVDDCVFNPDSVGVATAQGVTTISMTPRACFVAGPTRVVDIQVGALAAGPQRVDVAVNPLVGLGPTRVWSVSFTVLPLAEIAIFPPLPRPLTNYSGLWWNPHESGWGLSIHQSATRVLVVAWYVYDAGGQPQWFTVQGGRWTDFRTWTGTVYRTSGPQYFGTTFDPARLVISPVGVATLNFEQKPETVDTATFTFVVDGVQGTKTIRRMSF